MPKCNSAEQFHRGPFSKSMPMEGGGDGWWSFFQEDVKIIILTFGGWVGHGNSPQESEESWKEMDSSHKYTKCCLGLLFPEP